MIEQAALDALEAQVVSALDSGTPESLHILGYGEISTVLRADGTHGPVAAKRLPVMTTTQLDDYRRVLADYLIALAQRGITCQPSEVHSAGTAPLVPYCIQPLHPRLLVDELRTADAATADMYMGELAALVAGAIDGVVGFDAQISNWAVAEDRLVYYDVTTPLMRDAAGNERTDLDLFIASLPWVLRSAVRRFLLDEILSHYYAPRPALLDAIANLHKERLPHAVQPLLAAANRVVEPAITVEEVDRYYRSDARMWALLQQLRRADRWWQRKVRRRRYPFLLPGRIER
ncbi:MAG: DUF6206 family protein [Acidimicrobiia bacterium]|nr:DUF6206 family protein [Acidimicrobiia bacterium]